MRINDFQHQIELIKQEVLNDDRNYVQLLQTMGNNWRYDFINQLSIYDKNPGATACAKFGFLETKFEPNGNDGAKKDSNH